MTAYLGSDVYKYTGWLPRIPGPPLNCVSQYLVDIISCVWDLLLVQLKNLDLGHGDYIISSDEVCVLGV